MTWPRSLMAARRILTEGSQSRVCSSIFRASMGHAVGATSASSACLIRLSAISTMAADQSNEYHTCFESQRAQNHTVRLSPSVNSVWNCICSKQQSMCRKVERTLQAVEPDGEDTVALRLQQLCASGQDSAWLILEASLEDGKVHGHFTCNNVQFFRDPLRKQDCMLKASQILCSKGIHRKKSVSNRCTADEASLAHLSWMTCQRSLASGSSDRAR